VLFLVRGREFDCEKVEKVFVAAVPGTERDVVVRDMMRNGFDQLAIDIVVSRKKLMQWRLLKRRR
jgi:hypothetical protein